MVSVVREKCGFEKSRGVTGIAMSFGNKKAPREEVLVFLCWSRLSDSNRRPADYKSTALPTELSRRFI